MKENFIIGKRDNVEIKISSKSLKLRLSWHFTILKNRFRLVWLGNKVWDLNGFQYKAKWKIVDLYRLFEIRMFLFWKKL